MSGDAPNAFAGFRPGNVRDPYGVGRLRGAELADIGRQREQVKAKGIPVTAEMVEAFTERYLIENYEDRASIPELHREWWRMACSEHPRVAIAAPRGHAKSTAITKAYLMAELLFRGTDYAVIVSDTRPKAVKFMRDIRDEMLDNEAILHDFETKKIERDTEDEIIVRMRDGHKWCVAICGAEGNPRGLKWNNRRPGLFVVDDLEGDEQLQSKLRREKVRSWVLDALLPAGSTHSRVRVIGTIGHYDSLLERLMNDSAWMTRRYRAHHSFDDFSDLLWPDFRTEAWLRDKRQVYINQGNPEGYGREYLNDPVVEQNAYFRRDDLLPAPEDWRDLNLTFYAAWDFAISKETHSDYTCGMVVGVDPDGFLYVVDCRRGRWDPKEIVEEMIELQQAYKPTVTAVEKGVIEKAIGPYLFDAMRKENAWINLELMAPHKDKETRAQSWRAKTRTHSVFYDTESSWWPTVQDEMVRFPKSGHDDTVDPQAYIGLLLDGLNPGKTAEEQEEEDYVAQFGPAAMYANSGISQVTGY